MNVKNILCPVNIETNNPVKFIKIVQSAKAFDAKVHFLYVNDEMAGFKYPTDREDAVSLKLKETVPAELLESLDAVYAVSKGDLGTEVKNYCEKNKIDLIILTHTRHNRLYSRLFDKAEESIIDAINLFVLIVPAD